MGGYVGIPTSYTPVEYIESTGTQFIRTTYKPNSQSLIEYDYELTADTMTDTNTHILLASNGASVPSFSCICSGGGGNTSLARFCFGANYNYFVDFGGINNKTRRTVVVDCVNSQVRVNGNSYNVSRTTFSCATPLILNTQGTLAKIYSCKIYDNGNLVHNFLPVYDENNVACLYDQVEGKFYYNQGTGDFVAGSTTGEPISLGGKARKIKKAYIGIPTSYTPIEYIESSGTQYIDTGVLPNQNTGFEIDFTPENPINSSTYGWYIGSNNAITNRLSLNTYPAKSGGELYIGNTAYDPYLTQNVRKHITYKNRVFTDDDGHTYTVSASFSVSVSLYVFNRNDNGTLGGNNPGSMKLYGLKLYDGDTLTRDFIPVVDNFNVACLYEQVEGKFYYNQGAGTFSAGSATGEPVIIGGKARKIIRGYVGVNGVAKKCFGSAISYLKTITRETTQQYAPCCVATENYVLVAGGGSTSSFTTTSAVSAYDITGLKTSAGGLQNGTSYSCSCSIGGEAIVAGGCTTGWGNRVKTVNGYTDTLTRSNLTLLTYTNAITPAVGNSTHGLIGYGTDYNAFRQAVQSYDYNFVATTITSGSNYKLDKCGAAINNYIIFAGSYSSGGGVTDIYNNSNVKTTASNAYPNSVERVWGDTVGDYAVFFGGYYNSSHQNYIRAYSSDLVLFTSSMPTALADPHSISCGTEILVSSGNKQYLYDDNLVLKDTITPPVSISSDRNYAAAATKDFGLICSNGNTNTLLYTF